MPPLLLATRTGAGTPCLRGFGPAGLVAGATGFLAAPVVLAGVEWSVEWALVLELCALLAALYVCPADASCSCYPAVIVVLVFCPWHS